MEMKELFQKVDKAKLTEALSSGDPDQLRDVAKDAGFELSDEQLDYMAGGFGPMDEDGSVYTEFDD